MSTKPGKGNPQKPATPTPQPKTPSQSPSPCAKPGPGKPADRPKK
jgi:hypothetical protein